MIADTIAKFLSPNLKTKQIWRIYMQKKSLLVAIAITVISISLPTPGFTQSAPVIDSFTASATTGETPITITFTVMFHDDAGTSSFYYNFFSGVPAGGGFPPPTSESPLEVAATYPYAGSYTASLSVCNGEIMTDTFLCSDPAEIQINLSGAANSGPTINVSAKRITDVLLTCDAQDTESLLSRAWDFGDGTTTDSQRPLDTVLGPGQIIHAYMGSGTFTATCTATDSFGASAQKSVKVTIDEYGRATIIPITSLLLE
jgi:PKD repeat protein